MPGLFETSSTSSSSSNYPEGVKKLQGDWVDAAGRGMNPWFENPTYKVAPLNDWQRNTGTDLDAMRGQGMGLMGGLAGQGKQYPGMFQGMRGNMTPAVNKSIVGVNDINKYAGPISDMLHKRSNEQIGNSYRRSQSDIAQQEAARAGFSGTGSDAMLRRAMLDKNTAETAKDAALGNEIAGYQLGSSLAGSNADRFIGATTAANQFDMNAIANAFNATNTNRGFDLNALNTGLGFDSQTIGMNSAYGDKRQAHEQAKVDAPYTGASRFFNLFPGFQPNTTQTQTNSPSALSNAGSIISMLPFFFGS